MYLKEIAYDDVDWIHLAQDMVQWQVLANAVNEPEGFIRAGNF
jgi:hypothetical protein